MYATIRLKTQASRGIALAAALSLSACSTSQTSDAISTASYVLPAVAVTASTEEFNLAQATANAAIGIGAAGLLFILALGDAF